MTDPQSMADSTCIHSKDNGVADTHGALMDQVYRRQRLVYDATRKYYLLGRDHALKQVQATPGMRILEIACGTGRNLDQLDMRYPGCRLYGLDISSEMLRSARAKLGNRATLAQGDGCRFEAKALFDTDRFDRIVMSYCVSMIPEWDQAIAQAMRCLEPQGELHIVDFGDQSGLPAWFDKGLRNWLGRFHVNPRDNLPSVLTNLPQARVTHTPLLRGYAQYARVSRIA